MRFALYSPYLDTLGGGERYLATIAETLAKKATVDFFWDDHKILKKLEIRFNLDLSRVKLAPNIFNKNTGLFQKLVILRGYDVAIYLSDGSIPSPLAKENILHFQVPFSLKNGKSLTNRLKLARYAAIICNSNFTKKYVDESFGINSEVLYPPVDVNFFTPPAGGQNKEKIILSVGRFLAGGQGKKQEVLIEAFRSLIISHQSSIINDWQLWLAGGVADQKYVRKLQKKTARSPVKFFTNLTASKLQELYAKARIYWHAAGYGEDLEKNPQNAEHFGIAVVEAMAAGCVPIVFTGGGLTEIIDNGQDGFLWKDQEDLLSLTNKVIADQNLLKEFSIKATAKSRRFSKERFIEEFSKIIRE